MEGESLTPGAVATVTWGAGAEWKESIDDAADGVELWLVEAAGDNSGGELIGSGIGADCRVWM